jgi:hypothetical protein
VKERTDMTLCAKYCAGELNWLIALSLYIFAGRGIIIGRLHRIFFTLILKTRLSTRACRHCRQPLPGPLHAANRMSTHNANSTVTPDPNHRITHVANGSPAVRRATQKPNVKFLLQNRSHPRTFPVGGGLPPKATAIQLSRKVGESCYQGGMGSHWNCG